MVRLTVLAAWPPALKATATFPLPASDCGITTLIRSSPANVPCGPAPLVETHSAPARLPEFSVKTEGADAPGGTCVFNPEECMAALADPRLPLARLVIVSDPTIADTTPVMVARSAACRTESHTKARGEADGDARE